MPTNKSNGKMNKDTGKWCKFHKIPWHKINEFILKQSLVAELKALELDIGSDSNLDPYKGKHISDLESSATITTTKIQPNETKYFEEGEHLFSLVDVGEGCCTTFHC
jgi:hypothetical protein